MGLSRPVDGLTQEFNSIYNITLDMSGWDRTAIQLIGPMVGSIFVYGTLDSGELQGVREGSPKNATNFQPILATDNATGTETAVLTAPGTYTVPINDQYLRLQGSPAGAGTSIYKILMFHSKIS